MMEREAKESEEVVDEDMEKMLFEGYEVDECVFLSNQCSSSGRRLQVQGNGFSV